MSNRNGLQGHSGCKLELLNTAETKFVRKSSGDKKYNERLELQCYKQEKFEHEFIKTPRVLDKGMKDGLFYFDMEFINAQPFNKYLKSNPIKDCLSIFDTILNFVSDNLKNSFEEDYFEVIQKKLDALKLSFNISKPKLNKFNCQLPTGYCHGDLTFENILIKNNYEIYFIDFLDSYLDSPYIDLSKILQDLRLNWSNRNNTFNSPLIQVRNQFLFKHLTERMEMMCINSSSLELQRKITLLRILPYTENITLQLKIIENVNL